MFYMVLPACLALTAAAISEPVDLSHFYDNKTIYGFGVLPFQFIEMTILPEGLGDSNWFAANEFETGEHGGTHMDAPYHFNKKGWTIGQIPFKRLFGKAVYLNFRAEAKANRDYAVSVEDFQRWERQNGPIPFGAIVLLDFGWTEKYGNINDYLGTTDPLNVATYRFPGLSESGARWLLRSGNVFGVATDAASLDVGKDTEYPAHTLLTAKNVYLLEHVAFPYGWLDPCGYNILALPMKIRKGTGAPCRVLAMPNTLF